MNSEDENENSEALPSSGRELGSFSDRLREVMAGESQKKFADRVGLEKRSIGSYLRNEYKPKAEALDKISAATGYSREWLEKGTGPRHSSVAREDQAQYVAVRENAELS